MKIPVIIGVSLALASCANLQITTGKTLASAQSLAAAAERSAHDAYVRGALDKPTIREVSKTADFIDRISLTARCAYAKGDLSTVAGAINEIALEAAWITATVQHKPAPIVTGFATYSCDNPSPAIIVAAP